MRVTLPERQPIPIEIIAILFEIRCRVLSRRGLGRKVPGTQPHELVMAVKAMVAVGIRRALRRAIWIVRKGRVVVFRGSTVAPVNLLGPREGGGWGLGIRH